MSDAQDLINAIRVLRIELGIINDHVARAAGLHPRDLDVLDVIDRDAPCTPTHLATRTGTRAATLTGVLARLEAQGWIERSSDPRDRRSALVRPTARFAELRSLYRHADSTVEGLLAPIDPTTRARITEFLVNVADAARVADTATSGPGPDSPRG